jgi:hypothetical protein
MGFSQTLSTCNKAVAELETISGTAGLLLGIILEGEDGGDLLCHTLSELHGAKRHVSSCV